MYVEDKRSGSKVIFVFYFKDQNDFDEFIDLLEKKKEVLAEAGKEEMDQFISKFKSRVDNKYANEYAELSGCLFADEASWFITFMMFLLSIL